MTSVTVILIDGHTRTCILKQLRTGLSDQSSNRYDSYGDEGLEVIRKVKLKPDRLNGHGLRLQPLKEFCHGELSGGNRNGRHPIQERSHSFEEASGMDCDGGDSTDEGGQRMNNLKSADDGEPRMKCLKTNSIPSTSYTNGTDSSDEIQAPIERTVDVYMWDITKNVTLTSKVAKSCIPKVLIIVPIPVNGFGTCEVVEKVLRSYLDEVTIGVNKSVPLILFVDMQSRTTYGQQSKESLYDIVDIKQRHHCSLVELRHKVCTLLSYFPQQDYTCLEDKYYEDMFHDDDDLPPDQKNTLLKEHKIIRVRVPELNKYYVCTCPEKLIALFRHATGDYKQWKVETTKLLIKMKMHGYKHVALAALASLDLIYISDASRSQVCIAHKFSPERFINGELLLSRESNALRFTTSHMVDKLKILSGCDLLGWQIKKTSECINTGTIDVFLLSKERSAVLLWFEGSTIDDTNTYICEVNGIETSDRVRKDLSALRRCVGGDMTSFVYHRIGRESNTAEQFIQDSFENIPDDWLATNDASLYYKIDALALLRRWLSSSEEGRIEEVLNKTMDDRIISKLSALFESDTEIFFTEQGVDSATVNQIKRDSQNFKMVVSGLLKVWSGCKNNLYTLRKAIEESSHFPVSLTKFDDIVKEYLTCRQNARTHSVFPD